MPYALHTITPPGALVAGYHRGYEIHPAVVENWELVEGVDWSADPPDSTPDAAPVLPRPVDDSDRGAWVAYVVSRGTPATDAEGMDLDVLMGLYPEGEEADDEPARPADSARKSEWVLYVNDHPRATAEDQAWAGDDSTTKADLQAWRPATPGDTVAVAATEANLGS